MTVVLVSMALTLDIVGPCGLAICRVQWPIDLHCHEWVILHVH